MPEVRCTVENPPARRRFQADQVAQQRAFSAAAAAHDDKDIRAVDREGKVALQHVAAVGHGQVFNADVGLRSAHGYIPSTLQTTVMIAVATTMVTIEVTTAEVVAVPTAEALRPHCMPRMQPASATITPKTAP